MALSKGIEARGGIVTLTRPTSPSLRQGLQPREVLVLAGPALWTNRCLDRLSSEGYQARRDDPQFDKLIEWIKDPIAEAQRVAHQSFHKQTGRRIRFLHDT